MKRSLLFLFMMLAAVLAACGAPGQAPTEAPTVGVETTAAPAAPTPAAATLPAGETFQNPVLRNNFPDPFLLLVDGVYYAFATNGSGKNVQVATSSDLVKWQMQRDGMPALAPWVRRNSPDVWAPEVMKVGENYLLYYTARDTTSGKQCVGVAIGTEPGGRYKDANAAPLVCQVDEGGTIDASPYHDGGQLYLFYKNDGNCCGIATYIYVQKMAPDGLSLEGEPVRLIRNEDQWEGYVIEAPTMFKHEERYYLFYSANNYAGVEYAVGYAVCESAMGPCQKAEENPILASKMDAPPLVVGPGHQTLVQVDDQTWIVYHAWEIISGGRRGDRRLMWIDRLNWVDGKPVVEGPTTGPQPLP